MSKREQAVEYNREMRDALLMLWESVPKGQQKQALKKPRLKAALVRYGIVEGENE